MLHAYELAIPKAISSNMNIDNAADKDNAYINDTGEMCIRTNVPDGFIKVLKRRKSMATWNSRGLRGSTLEDFINLANEKYQQSNLALIQKIPTPINLLK